MAQLPLSQEKLVEQFSELLLTLEKTAQSCFLLGHVEQALQVLQAGMQVIQLPDVPSPDQARFKLAYANMLAVKTQFANAPVEEAVAMLEEVKQLAIQHEDEQLHSDALQSLGNALYVSASNKRDGDPRVLLAYFQEALEHRRKLHDEQGISESLFYVGLISDILGQKDTAQNSYRQALEIARTGGYARIEFEALRHLGFLEQARGNLPQAQQYFTESLHTLEQSGIRVYLPFAHVVLADVCFAQGDVELASTHCQQARELARTMDIKKALIFALLTSGRICQQKQELEQAGDYFDQAYAVAESIHLTYAMQQASSARQALPTISD